MSLLRDPEHGHLVGIEQKPHAPAPKEQPFPKWVEAHKSHIVTDTYGHKTAPSFAGQHVHRVTGDVLVLVNDKAEERRACSPKVEKAAPLDD